MVGHGPCEAGDGATLAALLDGAERRVDRRGPIAPGADAFVFSGSRHEAAPRALFVDRRLTPLERNAWQVFRLLLNEDGFTAIPTYEQLRPYLASMPCTTRASHETVARALTLLRLTRWLSLARRRRDSRTGRLQGSIYILHDEPLTPFEAMQLDADYLNLVSQALTHASKAIRNVGVQTLHEIADDPLLAGRTLPTRLQVLARRLDNQEPAPTECDRGDATIRKSEDSARTPGQDTEQPPSDSEAGQESASRCLLRNPKGDRTVRTEADSNNVRTVPRARDELRLPQRFVDLQDEQQSGALIALQQVDVTLQQAVLDEWEARCQAGGIRNPPGYLFGVIQKAIRGEFHAWAAQRGQPLGASPPSTPAAQRPRAPATPDHATVAEHLERLRNILRRE